MSLQKEIEKILEKFKKLEDPVDELYEETINQFNKDSLFRDSSLNGKKLKFLSSVEAQERNRKILQNLEIVKGNLRSKAIFSPIETQWDTICKNYEQQPALPITTWKCNVDVFI